MFYVNNHTLPNVHHPLHFINNYMLSRNICVYLYLAFMNRYTFPFSKLRKNFVALSLTLFLFTLPSCEEEEQPGPSSDYYVTYSWDGDAEYIITYWLQSEQQQYLSLNTGMAANQGTYISPAIEHSNDLDLSIKTAIEFSSDECANVQMTLYRDSVAVLTKDYIMGEPTNINCTGDNFRQDVFTP